MDKPTLLVTGASGSIGASLVARLGLLRTFEIVTLGKSSPRNDFQIDLCQKDSQEVVRRIDPDFVVHLAGNPSIENSFKDPLSDLMVNTAGTLNLLEGLSKKKKVALVFASTAAIYGNDCTTPFVEDSPLNPESPYAISKIAAEYYLAQKSREFDLEWTSLVISNSFGPLTTHRTGVIARIVDSTINRKEITLYGKHIRRDFIYVDDVCDAIVLALNNPSNSRLNISSNQEFSLLDVLTFIEDISQKKVRVDWKEPVRKITSRNTLDNSKSKQLLGWYPKRDFYSSLEKIVIDSLAI